MPRRIKTKTQRKNWRWYASMGLNGLVALAMVMGTVFLFTGTPTAQPASITAPTVDPNAVLTPLPASTGIPTAVPATP
ncbi:MAG TPA: hypothetical protein VF478_08890, partial [Anaerolineae bacterium]